jgi:hypothetical protein
VLGQKGPGAFSRRALLELGAHAIRPRPTEASCISPEPNSLAIAGSLWESVRTDRDQRPYYIQHLLLRPDVSIKQSLNKCTLFTRVMCGFILATDEPDAQKSQWRLPPLLTAKPILVVSVRRPFRPCCPQLQVSCVICMLRLYIEIFRDRSYLRK